MKNPITIRLSYDARMLIAATGATAPTAYRIDANEHLPAYAADHAEEHDITVITVSAPDIRTHGTVTTAAVAILTDAAPEPTTEPTATDWYANDLPRALSGLTDAVALDESQHAPAYMPRAQALACNAIGRRARAADVRRVAMNNGATPEHADMYVRHAESAGRHTAADRAYHATATERAADLRTLANDSRACDTTRSVLEQLAADHDEIARDERRRAELEGLY